MMANYFNLTRNRYFSDSITVFMCYVALFLLSAYFASRGLDLTDQGYLLAMQTTLTDARFSPIWGAIYFASLLNTFFQDWSYFASKYFAAIIPLLINLALICLLKLYFKINFRLIIICGLLSIWSWRSVLAEWSYYSTLSGLLISLIILLLVNVIESRSFVRLSFSLILLTVAIIVKFTNIIFICLLPLFLFCSYRRKSCSTESNLYAYIVIAVYFCSLLLLCSFAPVANWLELYIKGIKELFAYSASSTSMHTPQRLIFKSLQDLSFYSVASVFFILYVATLFLIERFLDVRNATRLQVLFSICFYILQNYFSWFEWNGLFVFYVLILAFICYENFNTKLCFFALSTLFFLLFSSFGSGNTLRAAFVAEPLACCLIILYLFETDRVNKYKKVIAMSLSLLILIGFTNRFQFSYRDLERWNLDAASDLATLPGIYSNTKKLQVLAELNNVHAKYGQSGVTALIYPSAPLLYKILELTPYFSNPWPNLDAPHLLKPKLFQANHNKPEIVIRLKRNPRKRDWPSNTQPIEKDQDIFSIQFLDEFVATNNYQLLHETEVYKYFVKR